MNQILTLSAAKRKDPRPGDAAGPSPLARLRTCAVAAVVLALPQLASACPVCFGGPTSIGKGMDTAILFLLSVVGFVQFGFVALFWTFWRRARELRRKRESFHLIEGGAR